MDAVTVGTHALLMTKVLVGMEEPPHNFIQIKASPGH